MFIQYRSHSGSPSASLPPEVRLNNLIELTYFQVYIIESMKYGAVYQLGFWNVNLYYLKGGAEGTKVLPPWNSFPFPAQKFRQKKAASEVVSRIYPLSLIWIKYNKQRGFRHLHPGKPLHQFNLGLCKVGPSFYHLVRTSPQTCS